MIDASRIIERYSAADILSYRESGLWGDETMFDLLASQVAAQPDKVFATDGTRSITFGGLYKSASQLAVGMHRRGWRAGDAVAVQLPNWVEFIEITVALSRLGVVVIPIMPIYRHDEVGYVLTNAGVRAVIGPVTFKKFNYLRMYAALRQDLPHLEIVTVRDEFDTSEVPAATPIDHLRALGATDDSELPPSGGADAPFVVVYTSGTTSRPKGCVHTFNTYCSGARSLSTAFAYTRDDVQFGPSPITHTTGLVTSVLVPLLNGAATHIMAEWEPERGLREIAQFGCTQAVTATTFLQMLLEAYDPSRHDASTLRLWTCAGSPIPSVVVERATAALPGSLRVLSLYGRSENLCTTTCSVADDPVRALTSDGAAMPGHEVVIVDDDGNEVPTGVEGDIAYRGPSHMIEYLNNPGETAALFTPSGMSRSGDLGRQDSDGFVRVTGRTKDIIIRGGMNISAREIEDLLAGHPDLRAAAVIGIPDSRLGEQVGCFVVAIDNGTTLSIDGLRDYLTQRGVAIQKTPEHVFAISDLPMTATGKVQKHILRQQAIELVSQVEAAR